MKMAGELEKEKELMNQLVEELKKYTEERLKQKEEFEKLKESIKSFDSGDERIKKIDKILTMLNKNTVAVFGREKGLAKRFKSLLESEIEKEEYYKEKEKLISEYEELFGTKKSWSFLSKKSKAEELNENINSFLGMEAPSRETSDIDIEDIDSDEKEFEETADKEEEFDKDKNSLRESRSKAMDKLGEHIKNLQDNDEVESARQVAQDIERVISLMENYRKILRRAKSNITKNHNSINKMYEDVSQNKVNFDKTEKDSFLNELRRAKDHISQELKDNEEDRKTMRDFHSLLKDMNKNTNNIVNELSKKTPDYENLKSLREYVNQQYDKLKTAYRQHKYRQNRYISNEKKVMDDNNRLKKIYKEYVSSK